MSPDLKKRLDKLKTWRGVPYQHRGTTRNGCDCTGFIIGAAKEFGYINDYQLRYYDKDWYLHDGAGDFIRESLSDFADPIPEGQAGDLVLFRFGKCIAHCGILLDKGLFIHAGVMGQKVTISKLLRWNNHIAGYYRIRGAD